MNKDTFSFIIYLIHAVANAYGLLPSVVYNKLKLTGCIKDYLVPHYDVLHTLGTEYLVEDIKEYLNIRGTTL